jgi:acetyltransferase
MQMLIDYARHEGITTIRGEVLADNTTMLRMCSELGFEIVENPDDSQIRIVTLPVKPAAS